MEGAPRADPTTAKHPPYEAPDKTMHPRPLTAFLTPLLFACCLASAAAAQTPDATMTVAGGSPVPNLEVVLSAVDSSGSSGPVLARNVDTQPNGSVVPTAPAELLAATTNALSPGGTAEIRAVQIGAASFHAEMVLDPGTGPSAEALGRGVFRIQVTSPTPVTGHFEYRWLASGLVDPGFNELSLIEVREGNSRIVFDADTLTPAPGGTAVVLPTLSVQSGSTLTVGPGSPVEITVQLTGANNNFLPGGTAVSGQLSIEWLPGSGAAPLCATEPLTPSFPICVEGGTLTTTVVRDGYHGGDSLNGHLNAAPRGSACFGIYSFGLAHIPLGAIGPSLPSCSALVPVQIAPLPSTNGIGSSSFGVPLPPIAIPPIHLQVVTFDPVAGRFFGSTIQRLSCN